MRRSTRDELGLVAENLSVDLARFRCTASLDQGLDQLDVIADAQSTDSGQMTLAAMPAQNGNRRLS